MPSILGFGAAAASVDCHLEVVRLERSIDVHWIVLREKDDRAARAQQRAVLWYGSDMMKRDRKSVV